MTTNGAGAPIAATFIILNFFLSYFLLTPRSYRMRLGFNTNCSPRQDMANYSAKLVAEGKITKTQLQRLYRWEACQANAVENYPLFIVATVFALLGNFSRDRFIGLGVGYTIARVIFAIAYIMTENETLSYIRSVFWWVANAVCFWAIIVGAQGIK